jgi:hypothetical protein
MMEKTSDAQQVGEYGEPWEPYGPASLRMADSSAVAAATDADDVDALLSLHAARRDRAIACVNACVGIEDPAELRRQRDVSVDALRAIVNHGRFADLSTAVRVAEQALKAAGVE